MEKSPDKRLRIIEADFPEIRLPNTNIWNFLHPYLEKWSNLTALVCSQTSKSYRYKELSEGSLRWAKELQKYFHEGTPPMVAILSPNIIEYPLLYYGAAAVGAPVCPISGYFNADLVLSFLTEIKAKVLVIDSSMFEKFKDVIKILEGKLKVFVRSEGTKHSGGEDLFKVLSSENEALDVETAKKVDPESLALLTFSSGTTGKPKGIMLSHKAVINNAACYTQEDVFPLRPADEFKQETIIATFPFSHVFGFQYYSLGVVTKGSRVVNFDHQNFFEILPVMKEFKPHVLTVNPNHLEVLSKVGDIENAFDNLKFIANIGSPHNPDAFKKLNEKLGNKLIMHEIYGASEMGVALVTPVKGGRPEMTGKLLSNSKARFVDIDTGEPILEPNRLGEMYIQGVGLMEGYLNNFKATEEAIDADNWFRTGDVGYFEKDNYIRILERFKDIITVNGEKVSPTKIEQVLKKHDSVLDVAVVGAPNVKTGEEEPKAFVIRRAPFEDVDLIAFVEKNSPPQMWLRGGVTFVESLPRNHLGKLIRKHVRQMTWSDPKNG